MVWPGHRGGGWMGLWGSGHDRKASSVTPEALGSPEAFMTLCGEGDLGRKKDFLANHIDGG